MRDLFAGHLDINEMFGDHCGEGNRRSNRPARADPLGPFPPAPHRQITLVLLRFARAVEPELKGPQIRLLTASMMIHLDAFGPIEENFARMVTASR